jgi:uncharacterized protein
MICPVCKTDMLVVERNRIELDYCHNCGGTWFDSGELDLLLASVGLDTANRFLAKMLASANALVKEKPRKCPICAQQMRKVYVGDKPRILIDACGRGDGLWFDGGELAQLLREMGVGPAAAPDAQNKISQFLGDMFQAHPGLSEEHHKTIKANNAQRKV